MEWVEPRPASECLNPQAPVTPSPYNLMANAWVRAGEPKPQTLANPKEIGNPTTGSAGAPEERQGL